MMRANLAFIGKALPSLECISDSARSSLRPSCLKEHENRRLCGFGRFAYSLAHPVPFQVVLSAPDVDGTY